MNGELKSQKVASLGEARHLEALDLYKKDAPT